MSMERLGRPAGIQGLPDRIATMCKPDSMRGRNPLSRGRYISYLFNDLRLQPYCDRIDLSCNPWFVIPLERLRE